MVSRFMGGWPASDLPPLERFRQRVKRCLADPTIGRASVPIDELAAVLEILDAAGR